MEAITFSDVLIKPKYSEIESRSEVDISSDFGRFKLKLPIISANMKSITGVDMACEMWKCGGLGILHRFCSIEEAVSDAVEVRNYIQGELNLSIGDNLGNLNYTYGVSIGVLDKDRERFDALYEIGSRIFVLDIAHGHSKKMKDQIGWIKNNVRDEVHIIAGNIATSEAARDLMEWGADSMKVGIGPGRACSTRKNTGVGVPQIHALEEIFEEIASSPQKPKLILDGGIVYNGDVAKALKYADAVMVGSFISGTTETPGKVFKDEDDKYYKVYMGSASGENKVSNGQTNDYVEGIAIKVPFRGHLRYVLKDLHECLQSSFSYTNSRTLVDFHKNCEFIKISDGGRGESKITS